jgi:hypothetical protein
MAGYGQDDEEYPPNFSMDDAELPYDYMSINIYAPAVYRSNRTLRRIQDELREENLNHVECHESLRNVIHVQGYPENFDADDVLRVFQKYDSQARIHDP